MQLDPPRAVLDIAEKLDGAGHDVWAVGGAVRDTLLGLDSGDWDLATSARPDDVRRLFRKTFPIGIEHGTVGVLGADGVLYEVTTFRRDVETTGRHAVVEFAHTIEEDLARRDFTFNAIAWHPIRDEVRDPYQGLADLQVAVLRTVGSPTERFAEDYLRVLRALRFAGHFVLQVEPATWTALQAATSQLGMLSAERVREELLKVLARTPHASAALELYRTSGVLEALYPELQALGETEDAWLVSLRAVDSLSPKRPLLRLAALLHATGMPAARAKDLRGGFRYTGHERFGALRARAVMERLKASNADTEYVTNLVARQSDLFPPDAPDAGVRRWLLHIPPALVNDFFRLRFALWRGRPVARGDRDLKERWSHVRRVLATQPPLTTADLAINGADLKMLGLHPGPQFGRILQALHDRVIDDPSLNQKDVLSAMAREIADAEDAADRAEPDDESGA
jgi:tRNA nucleotidyltransferase (CCA-adding enzyme)